MGTASASTPPKVKLEEEVAQPTQTHNPPWLRPPNGFKPGAPKNSHGTNSRAAAVGRALLQVTRSKFLFNVQKLVRNQTFLPMFIFSNEYCQMLREPALQEIGIIFQVWEESRPNQV